jgi:hypothetical protein
LHPSVSATGFDMTILTPTNGIQLITPCTVHRGLDVCLGKIGSSAACPVSFILFDVLFRRRLRPFKFLPADPRVHDMAPHYHLPMFFSRSTSSHAMQLEGISALLPYDTIRYNPSSPNVYFISFHSVLIISYRLLSPPPLQAQRVLLPVVP